MKKITFILSLLFAFVCGNGLLQAAPLTEAVDTLDHYVINGKPVDNFDGSQLVGKLVTSYEITLINHPSKGLVRIHEIHLNGYQDNAAPPEIIIRGEGSMKSNSPELIYVIDGKKVTKKEFESLKPSEVKSITVVKNGSQEDVKQYEGWENGVIKVDTKKGAKSGKKN